MPGINAKQCTFLRERLCTIFCLYCLTVFEAYGDLSREADRPIPKVPICLNCLLSQFLLRYLIQKISIANFKKYEIIGEIGMPQLAMA